MSSQKVMGIIALFTSLFLSAFLLFMETGEPDHHYTPGSMDWKMDIIMKAIIIIPSALMLFTAAWLLYPGRRQS
jgi:hypothetical protein